MRLVQNDDAVSLQEWVGLRLSQEHTVRGINHARCVGTSEVSGVIEPNPMTDDPARNRSHLFGDAFGHRDGGHSAGLGDADRLAVGTLPLGLGLPDHASILLEAASLVEERWDLRGLSRPRFGHDERHLVVRDGLAYLRLVFVDRQLLPCLDVLPWNS